MGLATFLTLTIAATPGAPGVVELFGRTGCPHCLEAHDFLEGLARTRPDVQVREWQVDVEARQRLERLASERGVTVVGVPALLVGETLLFGFDRPETTGRRIEALLDARNAPDVGADLTCSPASGEPCDEGVVDSRLLGRLDVRALKLISGVVMLGLAGVLLFKPEWLSALG